MPQYGKSELTDEQRKRQRTIIGGVLGCLGVLILLSMVAGFFVVKAAKGAFYTGPVDRPSMQQKIGQDVPLYPNAVVDELMTRTMLSTTGLAGKISSNVQKFTPTVVGLATDDSDQEILDYYRRELGASGWRESQQQRTARGDQYSFVKGKEMLMIQTQDHPQGPNKRLIMLMRMRVPGAPGETAPPDPAVKPPPTGDFPLSPSTPR